jgi:hypothetical protein
MVVATAKWYAREQLGTKFWEVMASQSGSRISRNFSGKKLMFIE